MHLHYHVQESVYKVSVFRREDVYMSIKLLFLDTISEQKHSTISEGEL